MPKSKRVFAIKLVLSIENCNIYDISPPQGLFDTWGQEEFFFNF